MSLNQRFFPGIFDTAVGERAGIRRKPYADSVLHVIDVMGASAEKTVYVGDSEVDVQTAKNAGIDEIAVNGGFRDADFLREQGAEMIVKRRPSCLRHAGD